MQFLKNLIEYRHAGEYVLGYLNMRRLIGILGIALPLLLIVGSYLPWGPQQILPSISDYYESWMRDLFVGIMCAVSLFLFCYKGLSKFDNRMANLAAIFALGVALFPSTSPYPAVHYIHLVSAAFFFATLAFISLFIFTIAREPLPDKDRKIIRNRIYRTCGGMILSCLLLLFVYINWEEQLAFLAALKPVFILETIALMAFGTSWLVKGKTLWANRRELNPVSAGREAETE